MNLLGHNYIAYRIIGHVSPNTLVGSHIPDFVPFLPASVFSFDEIHENHESFLNFVNENHPELRDLPLSMMCHSVKYGADEYNKEINNWLLENNKELTNEVSTLIAEASGISYETAQGPRLHNYLWCGIDLYLIKQNPDNITTKLIKAQDSIDYSKVAKILAEYYGKAEDAAKSNLKEHFKYIDSSTFQSKEAFTVFWSRFLATLKEHDTLNIEKGTKLLEYIYMKFEPEWQNILSRVEIKVRKKMEPHLI